MVTKVISDRYRILERIGQGGAAEVYKALDLRLNRVVAIKLLRDSYSDDPIFTQRFRNEAKAAAGLSSPFIVDVYDYDRADGRYFISMAYVEGQNLKDYLAGRAPLPEEEAKRLAIQILRGLATAHEAGLVHRDMKPQNVIVSDDGTLKITDFGIAKAMGDAGMTETGVSLGTPHYLSPEQAMGIDVTPRSDLYAVGVILYEMLSGQLPFDGDSPMRVSYAHVFDEPKPLREVAPRVSDGMTAVVGRAMAKDPDNRYTSADEMLLALEGATREAQPPVAAPRSSHGVAEMRANSSESATTRSICDVEPSGTAEYSPPKRRWRYGALLMLLLLLLAGGWYLLSIAFPPLLDRHASGGATRTMIGIGLEATPTATYELPATTDAVPTAPATLTPMPRDLGGLRASATSPTTPRPKPTLAPTAIHTATSLPTPTYASTPRPTETPVATPTSTPTTKPSSTPAPTSTLTPTSTVTPTANPTPTTPPTPTTSPPAQHAKIFLDDNQFTGGYTNTIGNRGRSSRWVYSQLTDYSQMSADFKLGSLPTDQYATLSIEGLDSEDSTKTEILIQINGQTVFKGSDPLRNDHPNPTDYSEPSQDWSSVTLKFPSSYLKTGVNHITFTNLERRGHIDEPPWFMLDYAVIRY